MTRTTDQALQQLYTSDTWREAFLRLWRLTSLLRSCLIKHSYRIPDDINNAIVLTAEGTAAANYLQRQEKVPVKESRLLCLLVFAYEKPLVDVEKTNIDLLCATIAAQIVKNEIRHPYVFGRLLYDRMSQLFPDEKDYLNVEDTQRLLDETPAGVWQVDNFVTGPYGILLSDCARNLPPTTRPPLQHCVDPSCFAVHPIRLETSHDAAINKYYEKIYDYLEKQHDEPADWSSFIVGLSGTNAGAYDDNSLFSVVYAISELLHEEEARTLLERMMNTGAAKSARLALEAKGVRGSSRDLCADRSHPELMQLLLLQSDAAIAAALDQAILGGAIEVPRGEVRILRVHESFGQGRWGLQPELSWLGFRARSHNRHLAVLRLRRLVDDLYSLDSKADSDTLEWLLRHVRGTSLAGRRGEYLRVSHPRDIVERLVLHSRSVLERAHQLLALEFDAELDEDVVVLRLLWRLGFDVVVSSEPNAKFWRLHNAIADLAHTSAATSTSGEEAISSAAGLYFPAVEELVEDTLVYATWALTTDHIANESPFIFDPERCREQVFEKLNLIVAESADSSLTLGKSNTLYVLINGFVLLRKFLIKLQTADADEFLREKLPDYVQHTSLKLFPFTKTAPFLDLTAGAQNVVLKAINDLHQTLVQSDVHTVRNSLLHYRRTELTPQAVIDMLDSVRDAILRAERNGLVRTRYERVEQVTDEWGRSVTTLRSQSGGAVEVWRPSPHDWLGMPSLRIEQYLFHCAVFDEPNEMLRFAPATGSMYSAYWTKFPARPAAPRAAIARQAQSDGTGELSARALE